MKIGDVYVYRANAEVSKPLCVAAADDSLSLTIFFGDDGKANEVTGVLAYEFENGEAYLVDAVGAIPANYYLMEERSRIK